MNISPSKKVENDSCHVAHEVKDTREKGQIISFIENSIRS